MKIVKPIRQYLLFAVVLTAALMVRDLGGIQYSKYILFFICIFPAIFCDEKNAVASLVFQLPLLCGIPGNFIITLYFGILIIRRRKIKLIQFVAVIFVALFELVASLWYLDFNIIEVISYIMHCGLFFCMIYRDEQIDYAECLRAYVLGCTVTCLLIIISELMQAPSNWLGLFAKGWYRFGTTGTRSNTAMQVTLNSNGLSYYSMAAIACAIVVREHSGRADKRFQDICLIILGVAGILSVSRTWFIVLLLLVLLNTVKKNQAKRMVSSLLAVLILISIVVVYLQMNSPEILEGIWERFGRSDTWTGNGRLEGALNYLEKFAEQPRVLIFGSGVVGCTEIMDSKFSVHNCFFQVLVCYGTIGAILFCYFWLSPILAFYKKRIERIYWIPFLCILLYGQTVQMIMPVHSLFPHLAAIFALRLGEQTKQQSDKRLSVY